MNERSKSRIPCIKEAPESTRQAFKFLCRHLVGLVVRQDPVDGQGYLTGNPTAFVATTEVIECQDEWFLLTAGHVLKDIAKVQADPAFRLQFYLADYFGPNPTVEMLTPFEFGDAEKDSIYQDGLDIGVIHLRYLYRMGLKANGITPFTLAACSIERARGFDAYFVIGFPTECFELEILKSSGEVNLAVKPVPLIANVIRGDEKDLPDHIERTAFPRFIGKLRGKDLQNAEGLSGGTIIGLDAAKRMYWPVAIQSKWLEDSRILLGTFYRIAVELVARKHGSEKASVGAGKNSNRSRGRPAKPAAEESAKAKPALKKRVPRKPK